MDGMPSFLFFLLAALFFPAAVWSASTEDPVANLFVHPLIAWPEKAFVAGSRDQSRMDEWFVTTDEFERALN